MRGQVLSWCVAVSLLAGCGSSRAVSTGSVVGTTATTGAATATTVGTATTTKSTAAAPTSSVAAGAQPKLTRAADNDFCHYLLDQGKKATVEDPPVAEGQSTEQLKQATTEAQTLYNEMAKRATAEIKADMSALSANFNRLAAIYASVGYDTVKLQQQMADPTSGVSVELGKIGATDSAAGADERVDAYIQNVCGLKG